MILIAKGRQSAIIVSRETANTFYLFFFVFAPFARFLIGCCTTWYIIRLCMQKTIIVASVFFIRRVFKGIIASSTQLVNNLILDLLNPKCANLRGAWVACIWLFSLILWFIFVLLTMPISCFNAMFCRLFYKINFLIPWETISPWILPTIIIGLDIFTRKYHRLISNRPETSFYKTEI